MAWHVDEWHPVTQLGLVCFKWSCQWAAFVIRLDWTPLFVLQAIGVFVLVELYLGGGEDHCAVTVLELCCQVLVQLLQIP